ncbi:MAG TPA: RsbRD N-terminal domain-containing protein [Thermodesulfovibrionales bacterium]|jgi:hypothetical protein|nr:RsbRD N-terminal domain-containing protein [Thermodesulfovibrionales bacterium]
MKLKNLLKEKRSKILKRWTDLILDTYPAESALFFRDQKNRFSNPVGHTITQGAEDLFEEILQGIDSDRCSTFLDNIIRVRAIQDFIPSQAVSFIFILKKVLRDEFESEIHDNGLAEELLVIESRIDDLALLSFDIFMKCREKIYELKAMELNNQTYTLLKKAKLIVDLEEQETDPVKGSIDNLNEMR